MKLIEYPRQQITAMQSRKSIRENGPQHFAIEPHRTGHDELLRSNEISVGLRVPDIVCPDKPVKLWQGSDLP